MAVWISLSISQGARNIANNTSAVSTRVTYNTNYGSWNGYSPSGKTVLTNAQGNTYTHTWKSNFGGRYGTSGTLNSYTFSAVAHRPDGSAQVKGTATFYSGVSSGTVTSSTGWKTFTSIPRTSTLSVNKTVVAAGSTIIATGTKASSAFTDQIVLTFGSHSATLTSGVAFTIPLSWCDAIPNSTSGTATITLTTKNGSTTVGTTSTNITITVPTSVVPSVTSITTSEGVASVTTAFGNRYVQNLSKIKFAIVGAGIYGSTIKSYSTTFNNATYTGSSFTSPVITRSGTLTYTTTVTDSRNRTATKTGTVTIVAYASPNIIGVNYLQCNADGTANVNGEYMQVTVTGTVSSVDSQNSRKLTIGYKKATETNYTTVTVTTSGWSFTASTILPNIEPLIVYNLRITLSDKVDSVVANSSTNQPNGLTVTENELLLINNVFSSYSYPLLNYNSDITAWEVHSISEEVGEGSLSGLMYLKYSDKYHMPVGVTRNGYFAYPFNQSTNHWSTVPFSSNDSYTTVAATTYQGIVGAIGLNATDNNYYFVKLFTPQGSPILGGTNFRTSFPVKLPEGQWRWITANADTLFILSIEGKLAYSNRHGLSWTVVENNDIIRYAPILDADFQATISSLCCLCNTTSGSRVIVTPTSAFK